MGIGQGCSAILQSSFNAAEMVEILKTPDILDIPNPETCAIKNGEIIFENTIFITMKKIMFLKILILMWRQGEKSV